MDLSVELAGAKTVIGMTSKPKSVMLDQHRNGNAEHFQYFREWQFRYFQQHLRSDCIGGR